MEHIMKGKNDNRITIQLHLTLLLITSKDKLIFMQILWLILHLETYGFIEQALEKLNYSYYCKPNDLFVTAYNYFLSQNLLIRHSFNRDAVTMLLNKITYTYKVQLLHQERWLV